MSQPHVTLPEDYQRLPERLNAAEVVLRRGLQEFPNRAALLDERGELTFAELEALSNRYGHALRARGLRRGDFLLIQAPNSREYGATILGALKLGAVVIPTSTLFRRWELGDILQGTGAQLMVTTAALLETAGEVSSGIPSLQTVLLETLDVSDEPNELEPELMSPDDPAFAICTSGSSGPPKRVLHGHRWVIAGGDPVIHVAMQFAPGDIVLMPQELSWLFVLGCAFLLPIAAGATAALYTGRFEPEKLLACIERYRATKLVTVPTVLRMLVGLPGVEERYDLGSLRECWCGGEPLAEETYRQATRRLELEIYELIGQTEVWLYMSNYPGVPNKRGSLGRLLPGRHAAVIDDEGRLLPPGESGHLVVAADDPAIALGYHGLDAEWQARIKGRWFYTGDIAYRDEEDYYFYVGRSDELIKSRGYRIAPGEVETATMSHPAVLEAGVVGIPDAVLGQRVKAFVVLTAGRQPSETLADEIMNCVRAAIAPYKAPKEIEFVAELPKTSTGKIDHRQLKE